MSGATLPDFRLQDDAGRPRRLSELQGNDLMVLLLGRGIHCPAEQQHQREMIQLHSWSAVGGGQLVTVLPNSPADAHRMRIATPAGWPFLCDSEYELQRTLDIHEYTDPHHQATVPHTLILRPGLAIDKVYVGYWFWGRPSSHQLWSDLQDLTRRMMLDYDPTTVEARQVWQRRQQELLART